ncbi:glutathione S-transferase family protein [Aestuariirhabdus litorea]|uniref:Glutathione S-transferase family protein n=1 Tax=Aestuariirhabdus litorea TaxID=2528527 RepID=A0A3P3VMQ9_9GAMM|nr:glutathione S-transferase family protein [Aestuariirhabdus litorea]RRJ83178.1 glutathione S-transferase family protein [Aestuariirhabdus litorea]RWW93335.1 glutathione S-transferase family protein [Endozoicomonadaceae bacterium GTF-13]
MGLLVDGKWQDQWYDTGESNGAFVREGAQFRNWITADGAPGPSGEGGFKAEEGRYHLYVSLACPWAHRTLIFRQLKGLESLISISVVHPDMLENGWAFGRDMAGTTGDTLFGHDYLHQLYTRDTPQYSGRVTVPLLWDKERERIVSNESSEIIRMLNSAFDDLTGNRLDLYPTDLRETIDRLNRRIYEEVNNGVYRAGFATTQRAYEEAVVALFGALDWLELHLADHRYLAGERITEADWRLFTTLVRFDAVYVGHFKCNLRRIADYTHLSHYLRELYQWPGVSVTVDMQHIKRHYYYSHGQINPTRVIPVGPLFDLSAPHDRGRLESL